MWLQIVGKVRLALAPPLNHWWHVPLYVTARGLTTSPIPYGDREFQVDFDFVEHRLCVTDADRGALHDGARAAVGRAVLPRVPRGAQEPRRGCRHLAASGGGRRRDPVRPGRTACLVRPGARGAAVASAGPGRPRPEALPDRLRRQGQPGPPVLGRLRPGDDALLRPARPAPSGWRPELPGLGDGGGRVAPERDRRLVAAERRRPGVLLVRLPGARGLPGCRRPSGRRRPSTIASASSCCRTTRSARPPIRTRPSWNSCSRPTRRAPTSAGGIAARSSRPSCPAVRRDGRGAWAR